jgi:glycosylphosphatidylinositol deacylase
MFENPVYHRILMTKDIQNRYPRYSLYSYCEGSRCEAHRRNQFSGIKKKFFFLIYFEKYFLFLICLGSPVLFIVGNADSYRQVRSLGSVAYRMGDQKKRLDYFSIDFNEELSALFGGVLEQQTEFIAYAIQKILSLYQTNKTIILVGNSIGGLLSRKIYSIYKKKKIFFF